VWRWKTHLKPEDITGVFSGKFIILILTNNSWVIIQLFVLFVIMQPLPTSVSLIVLLRGILIFSPGVAYGTFLSSALIIYGTENVFPHGCNLSS